MTMRATDSIATAHARKAMLLACLAGAGCARQGVEFRLEPAVVRACELPVATRVSWDVTRLGLQHVDIEVANLGEAPKAWTNGGAKGSETSGAWAQDGYTVILKSRNGVELARRTMTTVACPD